MNDQREYDATGLSSEEIAILESNEPETQETPQAAETAGSGAGEAEKAEAVNPAADPSRPDGFVPYQALKAERERAKALEQQAQEALRWQRAIAEKLAEARATPQQQQPQQEQVPNREEDPIGYIEYMDKRLAQIEQERMAVYQQQQEQQQWAAFEQDVNREVNVAIQEDPDSGEALEFIDRALAYEWQTLHSNTIPFPQYVQQMKREHAAYARRAGIPLRDYIRNVATSRGWSPGVLRAAMEQYQQPQQNSAAAAKIDALANAQAKNQTLGKNASGTRSEFTLEDLASMSGAELERFAAKNPELFDRLAYGQ